MATRLSDLSRLHVVIPVRSLTGGKARLGGALDAEERETLILGMLARELNVLRAWGRAAAVHVVSADRGVLELARARGVDAVEQRDDGLNPALRIARSRVISDGGTALLVLPADLPLLDAEALDRFLDAADATLAAAGGSALVVLAPADARRGTNALLASPPDAIEPAFGERSLEAHAAAAASADVALQLVVDPRLGFDLDTPADLDRLDADELADLTRLGVEAARTATADP